MSNYYDLRATSGACNEATNFFKQNLGALPRNWLCYSALPPCGTGTFSSPKSYLLRKSQQTRCTTGSPPLNAIPQPLPWKAAIRSHCTPSAFPSEAPTGRGGFALGRAPTHRSPSGSVLLSGQIAVYLLIDKGFSTTGAARFEAGVPSAGSERVGRRPLRHTASRPPQPALKKPRATY